MRGRSPPSIAAHKTWCADFKGHFRTADGTRCDPLTITDAHSRYLLRCHMDDRTPASFYTVSSRPMPRRVPELEYGDGVELRRVSQQGSLKMNGERTFISEIFAYEWLALRALD